MRWTRRPAALLTALAMTASTLGGCATIVQGPKQDVKVASVPPGASVKVADREAVTTPAELSLKRNKDQKLVFEKEGFPSREVLLESAMSWWVMGNLLFGGLVGIIVDMVTGSGYRLDPKSVEMDMATGKTREF